MSRDLYGRVLDMPWPWTFAVWNAFAALCYLAVGWRSGNLAHLSSTVFSSVDAGTYRQVADWIFSGGPKTAALAQRPILYPVVMGAANSIGGAAAVWLVNVILWLGSLNLAALAAFRFTSERWAAWLVFIVMATNVSLIVLTFHALAETLAVALLALWAYGLTRLATRITVSQAVWALLPITLLVIARPEFELLLGLMLAVVAVLAFRSQAPWLVVAASAGCLVPVLVQLWFMESVNHYFGLSEIGEGTIRAYFLARLYAALAHSADIVAQRPNTAGLSNFEVAQAVLHHPVQAVVVLLGILKENLLSGSNFVGDNNPTLGRLIVLTNYVYAACLAVLMPLVAIALVRARDGRLFLLSAAIANVLLTGSLSFWQGDRLTLIALPLWLVALVLATSEVRVPARWRPLPQEKPTAA